MVRRQQSSRSAGLRAALLALLVTLACKPEPPLPTFGASPRFSLTDQQGAPFSSDDLGGRLALADFIYTSCQDACPLLTANMARVQEQLKADGRLGQKVVLLSFSLDPERDTPAALRAYGERFGVDASGWKMLTGSKEALEQAAEAFKLGRPILLPPTQQNPAINLAHSNRVVLVDTSGQVRAYYRGDELDPEDVMRDIRKLQK